MVDEFLALRPEGSAPSAPLPPPTEHGPRHGLDWLTEGARVLFFRTPRWQGLDAGPATLLLLLLTGYLMTLGIQWALLEGTLRFNPYGARNGWSGFAASLGMCWIVARSRPGGPATATLLAVLYVAMLVQGLVLFLMHLGLRPGLGPAQSWSAGLSWTLWLAPLIWAALVELRLLWRVAGTAGARIAVLLLLPLSLVLNAWLSPVSFWWPQPKEEPEAAYHGLTLNDEVLEAQQQRLAETLQAVQAPAAGRVHLYGLTYAPYATQDVFMRESAAVARTMRERFGAEGRFVELVMNPATATTLPWATPLNLRKTIARMAAVMDRERDVLFLHLSSHGGADGKLSVNTWPLETEPVTPQRLRQWLDEAGVRWRVISVSACYSGSWIDALAGAGSLVMTAADATHTSYGCGSRSELTFFGRAMYVDALQATRSFEAAHARARILIEAREKEAGKDDGFSNPQIRMGEGIRAVLQRLQAEPSRD